MASKRALKRKQCGDKHRFNSVHDANQAAGRASQKSDSWISSYKCRFCGYFHIGHPPKYIRIARGR